MLRECKISGWISFGRTDRRRVCSHKSPPASTTLGWLRWRCSDGHHHGQRCGVASRERFGRHSSPFDLRYEPSDADLGQALEQNPFVTDITLNLAGVQQTDWNYLLHVIAGRANLERVEVQDTSWTGGRKAPAALVSAILRAIQQNTAIRSVKFEFVRLSTDISTFVDNASSITSFRLHICVGEQGSSRDLAAALQRNRNIERLELVEDIYTIPILEGLRSNIFLKTFIFFPASSSTEASEASEISDATSFALHQLLESTTSIQKFELGHTTFSERQFPLIAQAITSSECVSKLKFWQCRFEGQSIIAQLRSILQNKRNLTSLCLDSSVFDGGQIYGDIISILSRPESVLRCFEFSHDDLEQTLPDIQFKNLLQAIQISKLERVQIALIQTPQQVQTLTDTIPSMKLKELELELFCEDEDDEFSRETIRQDLLHAVKNNFSLRSVEASSIF